MPLIPPTHDSLPYIDRPPSPTSLARANSLIQSSFPSSSSLHPLLPPPPSINLSPTALSLFPSADISSRPEPLDAIDLSRYELPSSTSPSSSSISTLKHKIQTALIAQVYISLRAQALSLLEAHGKNAWLVGNAQLEDVLKQVETELVGRREEVGSVNRERKLLQENGKGELEMKEQKWRGTVGALIEVLAAGRNVNESIKND